MSLFLTGLLAIAEVLTVAFLGSFITQIGFSLCGVSSSQILQSSRLLFVFLISEAFIAIWVVCFFLRAQGESFRKIGWNWTHLPREVGIGLCSVPFLFIATLLVGTFFRLVLPEYVSTTNPLLELVRTRVDLMLFLISSILVGGLKEEIQRAFVLIRFEEHLGGIVPGLVLWSAFFGFGHQMQGVDNMVGAGLLGLLFGLLFVWRRKLVAPILSHALYDMATLAVFWNWVGPA